MGRELLRMVLVVVLAASKFWTSGNVQDSWLGAYWKLWSCAMQILKKVVLFTCLLVHYAIHVKL